MYFTEHQEVSSPHFLLDDPETKPVRIYTLGRFSLVLDGRPVCGANTGKPLELLKALIAYGGREVSETLLNEALWPDSDGDQAHSAFSTNLSRLRKLIGNHPLKLHNGQLSLDDRLCRVDTWEFDRILGYLEQLLAGSGLSKLGEAQLELEVERLFTLYRGPFLARQKPAGWVLLLRERLRSRFVRTLRNMVRHYVRHGGQCAAVIALYEKARELEPSSEEFCRGLMRCHAANDDRPQALAIFEGCHRMLEQSFGLQPSDQTRRLYHAIKNGDESPCVQRCDLCLDACD